MAGRWLQLIAAVAAFVVANICNSAMAQDDGANACLQATMRSDFKLVAKSCAAALAGTKGEALPSERRRSMLQRLGEAQFWARDYQGARMTFGVLVSEAPRDALALGWRSWAEIRLNAFDEAMIDGEQAVQSDPQCAVCWRSYGNVLHAFGRRREAFAALRHPSSCRLHEP